MKNTFAKLFFVLLAFIALTGCGVTFNPELGMTFAEWNDLCKQKNWTTGYLVYADGNKKTYYCDNTHVFHHFENDKLVRIDKENPISKKLK